MQALFESLKCCQCKSLVESPLILPCGDSICKKHVVVEQESKNEYHCVACDVVHGLPSGGFIENKPLLKLLTANIQQAKFCKQYEIALGSFKNLVKSFEDAKLFHKDPYFFINKTVGDLKTDVDILREEFKLKIDEKADKLIKELDEYEQECKSHVNSSEVSKEFGEITIELDKVKEEMDKWQKTLDNFAPNESEWNNISEASEKKSQDLDQRLELCKHQALIRKLTDYQKKIDLFTKIELKSNQE
jgi:hypothetical protein